MSESKASPPAANQKRVLLGIIIIVALAFVGLIAFVIGGAGSGGGSASSDAYQAELAQALPGADPAIGAQLVAEYDCAACHLAGDGSVSPLFAGIADAAAQRRTPLNAEQYLYEAIAFPAAHLVAGYVNAMPNNYAERLSAQEIGHIIAYLLTLGSG